MASRSADINAPNSQRQVGQGLLVTDVFDAAKHQPSFQYKEIYKRGVRREGKRENGNAYSITSGANARWGHQTLLRC